MGITDNGKIVHANKSNITLSLGNQNDLKTLNKPKVDIILAIPRPPRLERLLSVISCIGVGNLVLIGANKVQKTYFGSHLFQNPNEIRKNLIEGLCQAEIDYHLPNISIHKNLTRFIQNDLDILFPIETTHRIIAHPILPEINSNTLIDKKPILSKRLFDTISATKERIVIVIGPEGGWENIEINSFVNKGFEVVNVGERILRTDMAVSNWFHRCYISLPVC